MRVGGAGAARGAGTTHDDVETLITLARESGARKVYFASAAPPVRFPNVYGIDMPTNSELIAHNRSIEEIRQFIGADALIYQDVNAMKRVVGALNPLVRPDLTDTAPVVVKLTGDFARLIFTLRLIATEGLPPPSVSCVASSASRAAIITSASPSIRYVISSPGWVCQPVYPPGWMVSCWYAVSQAVVSPHDINGDTGLPYGTGLQSDPTMRYPRNWGFASNQLLVKLQYAFRY